ncbi:zinc finger BED domain-containing protein RICESLEEPER 2-like [Mercurialis annua]|uniref:zinc finger BED domain-containing protein RICESLEEPER 2-like n=1 Tax=Mercurialis annua TaxID=3986 RepID=UPI00215FDBD8|nr:zinc finger BED domain-containing protein RICESLEEPER 2-like [Mercurialis annua]
MNIEISPSMDTDERNELSLQTTQSENEEAISGGGSTSKSKQPLPPPPPATAPVVRLCKRSKSHPCTRKVTQHTALVWDHFKLIKGTNEGEGNRVACDYCGINYAYDSENHVVLGHMSAHLYHKCPKYPYRVNKRKRALSLESQRDEELEEGGSSTNLALRDNRVIDVEAITCALAKMVIVDGLSFGVVEGEGFKTFSHALEPRFVVPSRFDVARDCMRICKEEKAKLKDVLEFQRVCLTVDTWKSVKNMNYMCLVAHWIDNEWKLNKRILNFRVVPSLKGEIIGRTVETCLLQWGINEIFTVTVANANSDDGAVRYLRERTGYWYSTIMGHEFMHVRSATKILNLAVKEFVTDFQESIDKIRNAVKFVRSSPSKLEKFKRFMWFRRDSTKRLPYVDIEARWDSTYKMLETAEKCEKSFERLKEDDPNYVLHFEGDEDIVVGSEGRNREVNNTQPPNENDWTNARCFVKLLEHFHDAALQLSGSLHVTSTSFYHEFVSLQLELLELSRNGDGILNSMALHLKIKLENYLGNPDNINPMLFVAIVLDPRYKLVNMKYCFDQIYDSARAKQMSQRVEDTLTRMYDHYRLLSSNAHLLAKSSNAASNETSSDELEEGRFTVNTMKREYRRYLKEKREKLANSDVLRYLSVDCETMDDHFDILEWWKVNTPKYPVLSQIARDVLAIPVSTVSLESAFKMDNHVLDPFRSSLPPLMLEALMCGQNWLRPASHPIDLRETMDELEKYEEIESEFSGLSSAMTADLCYLYD